MTSIRRMAFFLGIAAAITIGACAPNKALTRDRLAGKETSQRQSGDEFAYTFEDSGDAAYEPARKRNGPAGRQDGKADREYAIREDENADTAPQKDKFFQTGMASWYGREFHGRMTASGERFDMKALTAAHRTLPFGTMIAVKNLDNGETVKVRINDRGPYRKNRILDLSYGAARQLNMLPEGEAKVGIQILGKGGAPKISSRAREEVEPVSGGDLEGGTEEDYTVNGNAGRDNASGRFAIQAGAFYSKKKAENLKERLASSTRQPIVVVHDNDFYKVRIEGIGTRKEAEAQKRRLMKEDIHSYVIETGE